MIKILEFLPNPVGKDKEGEYIKIFNDGTDAVSLNNWKIQDASGKGFFLNGYTINGGEFLVLKYNTTKIALNNNGESLFLYNASGKLIDETSYSGKAAEGIVYGKEIILSEKMRQELFEDTSAFAQLSANSQAVTGPFWLTIFLTAAILSFLSIYILKEYEKNN